MPGEDTDRKAAAETGAHERPKDKSSTVAITVAAIGFVGGNWCGVDWELGRHLRVGLRRMSTTSEPSSSVVTSTPATTQTTAAPAPDTTADATPTTTTPTATTGAPTSAPSSATSDPCPISAAADEFTYVQGGEQVYLPSVTENDSFTEGCGILDVGWSDYSETRFEGVLYAPPTEYTGQDQLEYRICYRGTNICSEFVSVSITVTIG